MKHISRREFLRVSALATAGAAAVACQPQTVVVKETVEVEVEKEKVVKETVVVEKEVEKVVEKEKEVTKIVEKEVVKEVAMVSERQAPELQDLVKSGALPPLEERMPVEPLVLDVFEEIGQYGGTWRRAYKGVADRWGPSKLVEEGLVEWRQKVGEGAEIVPHFCSKYEVSDDGSEWTFYLRKGLKWSDGEALNTDDVKFCYEAILMNETLMPQVPSWLVINDEPVVIEIVDDYTFKCIFAGPNAILSEYMAWASTILGRARSAFVAPEHYMKDYHLDYADQAAVEAAVQEKELETWDQLWGEGPIAFWFKNPDLPVMLAWQTIVPPPEETTVMGRNPYYWQVDPAGNQLPYIDEITHVFFENPETFNLMLIGGEIDCQNRHINLNDFTLLKENEDRGDYRVLVWKAGGTNAYAPNCSIQDPVLHAIFNDGRFRHALSIALNREEINQLLFKGLNTPRQASPAKASRYYDPEFEQRWTEYDPDGANALLDEMGLANKDGEGYRTLPDGSQWTITLLAGGPEAGEENELAVKYWGDIGLRCVSQVLDRSLYEQRCAAGECEIGNWGLSGGPGLIPRMGAWLGTFHYDPPWASLYGEWYESGGKGGIEPPEDHPIKKMWELWEMASSAPDLKTRDQYIQEIFNIHKEAPYVIGHNGESPSLWVVKNNFHNMPDGLASADSLRNPGLAQPPQLFFKS
jgi:peptide/nickel transport system substrate-binding protein